MTVCRRKSPLVLRKLSRQLRVLNARQQLDIARRGRTGVSFFADRLGSTRDAVGVHEPQPLCLELILRLLFVVHAPLYRCVHAGVGIERRSAVDLAAARNIEFGRVVRDRDDQLRREDDH